MVLDKMKIIFIVNPVSGIGKQRIIETAVEKCIDKSVFDFDIAYTDAAGHATVIAKEAVNNHYDVVVAVGGDGSVNEVADGIIGSDTALALIPAGSGNGLARHLNIPFDINEALLVINRLKFDRIDTATINDRLFVSIAGVGFDALVAKKFAKCRHRGFWSYFKVSILEYPRYKPKKYELIIDGNKITRRALLVSFANSNQFGYNTSIAPGAVINDGLLDICILKKVPVVKAPYFAHLLFNKSLDKTKYLEIIQGKEVQVIRKKNSKINIDGNPMRLSKELLIKINPLSLKVIIP
jgi:diacylglycerol kinase (ATP)